MSTEKRKYPRLEEKDLKQLEGLPDALRAKDTESGGNVFANLIEMLHSNIVQRDEELQHLCAEVEELQRVFDLRWKADRRGTKRWQEAHPGNDHVWPDHADMVVWLLEQLDKKEEALKKIASCKCQLGGIRIADQLECPCVVCVAERALENK